MPNKFDRVIQENIQGLTKTLVRRIMDTQRIDEVKLARYHAHSALEYGLPVLGLVIYIGREPVNMPVKLDYENIRYSYRLIDLTELNPDIFLESEVPEEIIMAVLAGKTRYEQKREIIRKILFKLRELL